MEKKQNNSDSLATAGMIIGIVALLFSCIILGGLVGIVGLALSIAAVVNQTSRKKAAITGIVLNALSLLMVIIVFAAIGTTPADEVPDTGTETEDIASEEPLKESNEEIANIEDDEPIALDDLLLYEVHTSDVKSGGGNVIGTYAYIEVAKSDLKTVSLKNFISFCEYVSSCDYNWFTIKCDDGTGIVFTGCDILMPTYGVIDNDGMIAETIGFIKKESDYKYSYSEQLDTEAAEPIENEQDISDAEDEPSIEAAEPQAKEPATESSTREVMVWVCADGNKYHSRSSCSNMENPYQVTLQEAERMGKEPCKRCH